MGAKRGIYMYALPHEAIGFTMDMDLPLLRMLGIGLQEVTDTSYCWDNHNRQDNHCILQYTVGGCGALELEGVRYDLTPGSIFLVDVPGPSRYYLPESSPRWEFFFLEFSKECLPMLWKIYRVAGPVLHLSAQTGLASRVEEIYRLAVTDQLHSFFENTRLAYEIWTRLTEYAVNLSARKPSRVDFAKRFLDQNFRRADLSLDVIADHAGFSKYYLCKEFHKEYGVPPGKYLRNLRIAEACRLLTSQEGSTIQSVAEQVGFSNDNYFCKVFKAEKGVTPDRYRKTMSQYDVVRTLFDTAETFPDTSPTNR